MDAHCKRQFSLSAVVEKKELRNIGSYDKKTQVCVTSDNNDAAGNVDRNSSLKD